MPDAPQLRIAVCGHRQLLERTRYERAIDTAAEEIREAFPGCSYHLLSCLAEGADRMLVERLLPLLDARLVLVLPLAEEEYLKDFRSDRSRKEYFHFREQVGEVIQWGNGAPRPWAYREANRVLVSSSDLVVSLWNGRPARGPGGTAEAVGLAREEKKPLLWIRAVPGRESGLLTVERLE